MASTLKTLAERREVVKIQMGELIYLSKNECYKPITKIKLPSFQNDYEIKSSTLWIVAFEFSILSIQIGVCMYLSCPPNVKIYAYPRSMNIKC